MRCVEGDGQTENGCCERDRPHLLPLNAVARTQVRESIQNRIPKDGPRTPPEELITQRTRRSDADSRQHDPGRAALGDQESARYAAALTRAFISIDDFDPLNDE